MMVRAFMFVIRLIGIVVVVVRAGSGVQRITGPKLTNVTGRYTAFHIPRPLSRPLGGISGQPGASQFCDECETATVEALQEP